MDLNEVARGAIECHLGDVCECEVASPDAIYDEAFAIAHDALLDRGVDPKEASRIAAQEAQKVAQP